MAKNDFLTRLAASSKGLLLGTSLLASAGLQAETFTPNFVNTDIKELIKYVADANNLTVVVDPNVKGKVEVLNAVEMDEQQLYDLFLSILDAHGFSAIRQGDLVRVVKVKKARSSAGKVVGKQPSEFDNEFVTQVIQLKNVNAAKLIPVLRPLVPQQGHMAAYADSNAILIATTTANIERVRKIIEKIDTNATQESEFIQFKHASAEEVVRILQQLEKSTKASAKGKSASQSSASMVADARTNTLIITGDANSRKRIKRLASKLDSPLESAGNARVVYLKHAKAKDLAEVLTKVVSNIAKLEKSRTRSKTSSSNKNGANIEADEATNALIITAPADVMRSLDSMISRLDIPRAQILVEAIIVEVQNNNGKSLGVDWLFANEDGGYGSTNVTGSGTLNNVSQAAFQTDATQRLVGLAAALGGAAGGTFGIGRVKTQGTSLSALITALQTQTAANILSTPTLLTMDNNEATITVGQEVPIVTGSYTSTGTSGSTSSTPGNPFQTVDRQNVGITLKVTPHISDGGNVELELNQEVSSLVGSTTGFDASAVITNERKIDTTVVSKNGEIVVLGGLIQDEVQETQRKVPFLGDIPVLGHLFRSTSTSVVKTNLLVFIKPTIIQNQERLKSLSKDKYNFIREQQIAKRNDGVDLFSDDVLPVLPEWEKQISGIVKLRQRAQQESAND